MVYSWTKTLQSILFPSTCRLCRAAGLADLELCPSCREELPWIAHGCRRCALPLPVDSDVSLCSNCINKPPSLDEDLATARLLGELLASNMAQISRIKPAIVVPVPLHRKRLAERGYNQALEIARPLSKKGYRLDPICCRRHKPTSAQSDLPASARKKNVHNAFSAIRPLDGLGVLLIDDVMTTGATLNELAGTLKKAGAERVAAWVIARTGQEYGDRV
jgi:ComF family protein